MKRFVVISGCSGGGKSTLLTELATRGCSTVEEPGRRIVKQELEGDGSRLPWVDMIAFAQAALALALEDYQQSLHRKGRVFFDRGIVDAAAALAHFSKNPEAADILRQQHYNPKVFLTPPWPEIYEADAERKHGFHNAVAEYERLLEVYAGAGYVTHILPKVNVGGRADFVFDTLAE